MVFLLKVTLQIEPMAELSRKKYFFFFVQLFSNKYIDAYDQIQKLTPFNCK